MQESKHGHTEVEWMCFCGPEQVFVDIVVGCDGDDPIVVYIDYIWEECFQ